MKTEVEAQRRADFLQHFAILHLGKAAAANFFRRGHPENADAAEAVDHVARNICLAIDLVRVEMFDREMRAAPRPRI